MNAPKCVQTTTFVHCECVLGLETYSTMPRPATALQYAKASWKTFIIIVSPVLLMPLTLPGTTKESKCAYGLLLMCVYWITEALPLPVTALLPIVVFPVLGVAPSEVLSTQYIKDVDFLLIGGLIIATAIEKCNIHKRFALRLLMFFGVSSRRFLLAFLVGTAFMSLWINNTAATTMMFPIARALLDRLFTIERHVKTLHENDMEVLIMKSRDHDNQSQFIENTNHEEITLNSDNPDHDSEISNLDKPLDFSKLDEHSKNLVKAISLCICYGAHCGGIATLTGAPPNLVVKAHADELAGGSSGITFLSWMVFTVPVSLISLFFIWFWLQLVFLGPSETFHCRKESDATIRTKKEIMQLIRKEYKKLGPMSFSEHVVLVHLILLILLWLTRNPGFFPGYANLFHKGYVSDAVPSVLVILSIFLFPTRWPSYLRFKKVPSASLPSDTPSIIQWSDVTRSLPWGVILLLGGGFALTEACKISGLSQLLAHKLYFIKSLGPKGACFVVVSFTCFLTEFMSNMVVVSLFVPIIADLAISMEIHPLYFMLPAGICASFAFMLPVAAPPNAIIYSYGDIKISEMAKAGFVLNIFNILLVTLAVNTWGTAYFDLNEFPVWANRSGDMTSEIPSNLTKNISLNNLTKPFII